MDGIKKKLSNLKSELNEANDRVDELTKANKDIQAELDEVREFQLLQELMDFVVLCCIGNSK